MDEFEGSDHDPFYNSTSDWILQHLNLCVCSRPSVNDTSTAPDCSGTCHIPTVDPTEFPLDYSMAVANLNPNRRYLDLCKSGELSEIRYPEEWGYLRRYPSQIAIPIRTPTERPDDLYHISLGYDVFADFQLDPDPSLDGPSPELYCLIIGKKVSTIDGPAFVYSFNSSQPKHVKVGYLCVSQNKIYI